MNDDTRIIPCHQPGSILDPLTEIAREGARRMRMAALRAEADSFVAQFGFRLDRFGQQAAGDPRSTTVSGSSISSGCRKGRTVVLVFTGVPLLLEVLAGLITRLDTLPSQTVSTQFPA